MNSRKSCFGLVEKRLKFDVDQAPPRNTQKSKMSIFQHTVSTLEPPSRENRGVPRDGSRGQIQVQKSIFFTCFFDFDFCANEIINIFRNAEISPFAFSFKTDEITTILWFWDPLRSHLGPLFLFFSTQFHSCRKASFFKSSKKHWYL